MAGRFTNTKFKDTVNSVVSTVRETIKNPYYVHLDKNPVVVDYYRINTKASTLDQGALIEYSSYGLQSPIQYDFIEDFFLYGIGITEINLTNEDFGIQADTISGEAFLLPNTIIPIAGDYFAIKYMKEKLIYKVTGIDYDTLDTGANMYKINYELVDDPKFELRIYARYKFIVENVGTDFNCLIQEETFSNAVMIDELIEQLKNTFMKLFYNNRVQTFTYQHNLFKRLYDPFMIEFLKRNKIMEGSEPYIYIDHATPIDEKSLLRYDYSIFKAIEECDKNVYEYITKSTAIFITNRLTMFYARPEDYYQLTYCDIPKLEPYGVIAPYIEEFLYKVMDNTLFDEEERDYIPYNILIKYFNDEGISIADIEFLKKFRFKDRYIYFYILPALIFCLNKYLDKMMGK